ncbi:unnamed protein product, partial [Schistosoma curassoni]|uniref:Ovule protein n=1 Tax=Schistosoma curassoni TaxID=6186 RepID=A0A183L0E3_9TREM
HFSAYHQHKFSYSFTIIHFQSFSSSIHCTNIKPSISVSIFYCILFTLKYNKEK